jgi:hypothetical protein
VPGCRGQRHKPRAGRTKARAEAERERAQTALTFEPLVNEWAVLHLSEHALATRRKRFGQSVMHSPA